MINREKTVQGKKIIESRTGTSGHYAMPFFAIDNGIATEEYGQVWFGSVHWSGNWKIAVDRDGYEQTSIMGGINDFDFSWNLSPEEVFTSPVFSAGFSTSGFGGMTNIVHDYLRNHVEPENLRGKTMPVICNTYASLASGKKMNEDNVKKLADSVVDLGIELFVLDAGWQKNLGEWVHHPEKFPGGMKYLSDYVHSKGMLFGLWVEIESVDTESDIFKNKPEWIMNYPEQGLDLKFVDGSTPNRVLLNLARTDVCEYLFESMDTLARESNLDYLKLDMNRYFTMPGWENPPHEGAQSIWVKYVHNLYSIFERLRKKYPDLMLENCAAGNGRADWGMNRMFSRVNRSDNQDSLDVLKLHEGFSYIHLPKYAGGGAHISDFAGLVNLRNIPMYFKAFSGMLGSLAIGKHPDDLSKEEYEELKAYVQMYKILRQTTQNGNFYRLSSLHEQPVAEFEYVSKDQKSAVIFIFSNQLQFANRIAPLRPRGLNPDYIYDLTIYGDGLCASSDKKAYIPVRPNQHMVSGKGLMAVGIDIDLSGDYAARVISLNKN
jgi:alpha-galactosidase